VILVLRCLLRAPLLTPLRFWGVALTHAPILSNTIAWGIESQRNWGGAIHRALICVLRWGLSRLLRRPMHTPLRTPLHSRGNSTGRCMGRYVPMQFTARINGRCVAR
jgi:hypothetical protein